jgi:hypothetical protein
MCGERSRIKNRRGGGRDTGAQKARVLEPRLFCLGLICSNLPGPRAPESSFDDLQEFKNPLNTLIHCARVSSKPHLSVLFTNLPELAENRYRVERGRTSIEFGWRRFFGARAFAAQLRPGTAAAGGHSSG